MIPSHDVDSVLQQAIFEATRHALSVSQTGKMELLHGDLMIPQLS
jgi:hypothetical protein